MIKYLLDTNAWLNILDNPECLSEKSRLALRDETAFAISPMSIVEIVQKNSRGRLVLNTAVDTWITQALGTIGTLLPITPQIVLEAYRIPDFHDDPADRIISATARIHDLILVTSDKKLIAHPSIRTLSTR
jgi:PIN domain nuclease of toxin-antitoxin system